MLKIDEKNLQKGEGIVTKYSVSKVKKRDGSLVDFDPERIVNAIFKAACAVAEREGRIADRSIAEKLAEDVVFLVEDRFGSNKIPSIEDIQDIVEKVLIENGHAKTAKAYILYRQRKSEIRKEHTRLMNGRTTKLPYTLNALNVVAKRYLVTDEDHNIVESPEEMLDRVATAAGLFSSADFRSAFSLSKPSFVKRIAMYILYQRLFN